MNNIAFPGLGLEFNINSAAFSVFGKPVYWYGILIALGMLLAVCFAMREEKKLELPKDTVTDLIFIAIPSAIVGARLYYVLFSLESYISDPVSVLYIWEGGLAIYGGLIAGTLAGFIYSRVKKLSFMKLADCAAIPFLIGQAVGRWGNFVNCEAYGTQTDVLWRMEITEAGERICVHPTFLYESLWNTLGIIILLRLRKNKPFDGFVFLLYVVWYGVGRMMIEGLRTDSLMLGNLRISQLLSLVFAVAAAIIIAVKTAKIKKAL